MGTTWSVRVLNPHFVPLAPVQAALEADLAQVVHQMSPWALDSDLSRFNRAPAGTWHSLQPQFGVVLQCALHWAQVSQGAYDPTIGPLVDVWGFGPRPCPWEPHAGVWPHSAAVEAARQRVGFARIVLDATASRLCLYQPGGMQLDLCGIAKGFAVDMLTQRLQQQGFEHFLVEVGGELRACGLRCTGQAWRVAIAAMPEAIAPTLALHNRAVATSGDSWHAFEHNGQRYSHTIDPRTAMPVHHALASVTVLHDSCMQADVLASVLTVMGPQCGWEFARTHDIAALWCQRSANGPQWIRSPCFDTPKGCKNAPKPYF